MVSEAFGTILRIGISNERDTPAAIVGNKCSHIVTPKPWPIPILFQQTVENGKEPSAVSKCCQGQTEPMAKGSTMDTSRQWAFGGTCAGGRYLLLDWILRKGL